MNLVNLFSSYWNTLTPKEKQQIWHMIQPATQRVNVKFTRLSPEAHEPTKGSEQAAGWDLYAALKENETILIHPGEVMKIPTGISMELPQGTFGAIYARSGLATKQGLAPSNKVGVIDSDYRGEILVALRNESTVTQTITAGMRIAQLVIQPYIPVLFQETSELSDTARGSGGFGSTGTE